MGWRKLAPLK
uniref:Uncharacterized protein n=1 Tax=Rhizophora mucronata TaxID=61149 RepID=A0A2P2PQN6_RHIMU